MCTLLTRAAIEGREFIKDLGDDSFAQKTRTTNYEAAAKLCFNLFRVWHRALPKAKKKKKC
jgi:hypothetical protein